MNVKIIESNILYYNNKKQTNKEVNNEGRKQDLKEPNLNWL